MNPPRYHNDPYFWLRDDDRKNEEVLAHLRLENEYGKSMYTCKLYIFNCATNWRRSIETTAALDPLRMTLYEEHKGHLKETDDSPPLVVCVDIAVFVVAVNRFL